MLCKTKVREKDMSNKIFKTPKSERLSDEELQFLRDRRAASKTAVEAATSLGIDRSVFERVLMVGSGRPDKVAIIRKAYKASLITTA